MPTILVVDDDADTRQMLAKYLERAGYSSLCAANGWEALIALDDSQVDLILLDVMMPGMNGITFLNILRNAQRKMSTPVVLVTAFSDRVEADARELGVSDILPKTSGLLGNLLESVNRIVGPGETGDKVYPS